MRKRIWGLGLVIIGLVTTQFFAIRIVHNTSSDVARITTSASQFAGLLTESGRLTLTLTSDVAVSIDGTEGTIRGWSLSRGKFPPLITYITNTNGDVISTSIEVELRPDVEKVLGNSVGKYSGYRIPAVKGEKCKLRLGWVYTDLSYYEVSFPGC